MRRLMRPETVVVLAILLIALVLRLLTWERFLPVIDYVDEPNMYLLTRSWRGIEQVAVIPQWLAGYPPLYMWISGVVQPLVESSVGRPWVYAGEYIGAMRFLAVWVGVLTTWLLYLLGKRSGGAVAGVVAAIVWAVSPIIVASNSLAVPDPFIYLAMAFTMWCAVAGWPLNSSWKWRYGLLFGVIALILLKYSALYVLLPYALVIGHHLFKQPKATFKHLIAHVLIGLAALSYLAFGHQAFSLSNREAVGIRESGITMALSPLRWLNNLLFAFNPIVSGSLEPQPQLTAANGLLAVLTAIGSLAGYLVCWRRGGRRVSSSAVMLLVSCIVSGMVITASFTQVSQFAEYRHILPLTVVVIVLWASCVAQIGYWADEIAASRLSRYPVHLLSRSIGVVAVLILLTGSTSPDQQLIAQFRKFDHRQVLWEWADQNLPPEGRVLFEAHSHIGTTFNRYHGGYDGVTPFDWWLEEPEDIMRSSAEEYRERGIVYLALADAERSMFETDPRWPDFIGDWTLLKEFPKSDSMAGDAITVYRAYSPLTTLDVSFGGEIALVGYDLDFVGQPFSGTVRPGETLEFRPYWRMLTPPSSNYSVFVHLSRVGEDAPIAQADGSPASPSRPTLTWNDPTEMIIGQTFTITISEDAQPGLYNLRVGLYDYTTGQRLTTEDGDAWSIPIEVSG